MKLTITTLVIVEGSYIQGMENSSEEEYMNQLTDIKLICNEL